MEKRTFRIHGVYQDGTQDTWLISGTIDEIREQARNIVEKRNLKEYWSEEV